MEYISEAKTKVTDLEVVKNAKFYSLSMDGRTDEGCVEQKTLFVRVCNQSKWTHKFFTLGNPPQLVLQICMHLCLDNINNLSLDLSKMVGFGCDGAANMVRNY